MATIQKKMLRLDQSRDLMENTISKYALTESKRGYEAMQQFGNLCVSQH